MMHSALLRIPAAPAFVAARPPAAVDRRLGRAAPRPAAKGLFRFLDGWMDGGYRPERHYMRGGRTAGAKSLAAAG